MLISTPILFGLVRSIAKPVRVDEMRTRSIEGNGLGLAIVANIVNQHNSEVWAEQSVLNGLRVVIKLPLWYP